MMSIIAAVLAAVTPLYVEHNNVHGETPTMTNTEAWASSRFLTKYPQFPYGECISLTSLWSSVGTVKCKMTISGSGHVWSLQDDRQAPFTFHDVSTAHVVSSELHPDGSWVATSNMVERIAASKVATLDASKRGLLDLAVYGKDWDFSSFTAVSSDYRYDIVGEGGTNYIHAAAKTFVDQFNVCTLGEVYSREYGFGYSVDTVLRDTYSSCAGKEIFKTAVGPTSDTLAKKSEANVVSVNGSNGVVVIDAYDIPGLKAYPEYGTVGDAIEQIALETLARTTTNDVNAIIASSNLCTLTAAQTKADAAESASKKYADATFLKNSGGNVSGDIVFTSGLDGYVWRYSEGANEYEYEIKPSTYPFTYKGFELRKTKNPRAHPGREDMYSNLFIDGTDFATLSVTTNVVNGMIGRCVKHSSMYGSMYVMTNEIAFSGYNYRPVILSKDGISFAIDPNRGGSATNNIGLSFFGVGPTPRGGYRLSCDDNGIGFVSEYMRGSTRNYYLTSYLVPDGSHVATSNMVERIADVKIDIAGAAAAQELSTATSEVYIASKKYTDDSVVAAIGMTPEMVTNTADVVSKRNIPFRLQAVTSSTSQLEDHVFYSYNVTGPLTIDFMPVQASNSTVRRSVSVYFTCALDTPPSVTWRRSGHTWLLSEQMEGETVAPVKGDKIIYFDEIAPNKWMVQPVKLNVIQ